MIRQFDTRRTLVAQNKICLVKRKLIDTFKFIDLDRDLSEEGAITRHLQLTANIAYSEVI